MKRLQPPSTVSKDRIVQSWFRVVHLLGNPVDLCHPHTPPNLVSPSSELEQLALGASAAASPSGQQHALYVFHAALYHRAMTAVAIVVDLFLGRYRVPVIAPRKSVSFDTSALSAVCAHIFMLHRLLWPINSNQ